MSNSLGFFNKYSKQTLLSSSFDSLRSLSVYMSLPRHLTCLIFILLLVMATCGAQGRVWRITHTCITCIAKSKTGSKEKNKSCNQIKMCTCMDCDGWNGNSFCMISLPIYKIFLKAWLSFFSWTFMCRYILSFFSTLGPSCVHIFFYSPCFLFFFVLTITGERERPTHTMELLFCGMDGWYNANFS